MWSYSFTMLTPPANYILLCAACHKLSSFFFSNTLYWKLYKVITFFLEQNIKWTREWLRRDRSVLAEILQLNKIMVYINWTIWWIIPTESHVLSLCCKWWIQVCWKEKPLSHFFCATSLSLERQYLWRANSLSNAP